jgi:outer membrane protein assembly factor BamB
MFVCAFVCACLCALLAAGAAAADGQDPASAGWPGWRGAAVDGHSDEVPAAMPAAKLLWSKPMAGECRAGVVAAEGYVVVCDSSNQQEEAKEGKEDKDAKDEKAAGGEPKKDFYRCYEAPSGKEAWTHAVRNTVEKMDYGAAPRATPRIYRGKVYCIGAVGDMYCLDLKTGKVLWQKKFSEDFQAGKPPYWGYSVSPIIVDGQVVIMPRNVVALDPNSGKVTWTGKATGPNYSTPIAGEFGGVRQVIAYDANGLGGWEVKTGKRLWTLAVDTNKGYIVPTPVALAGKLFLSTPDEDARIYAFDKEGKLIPKPLAESGEFNPEMATATLQGDLLLGICEGLVCLDPSKKLKKCWIQERERAFYGLGHIVASKDRALVFGQEGTMVLVKAEPDKCTVLGSVKLCKATPVWSHAALAGGKVYIRDPKQFYCYDLAPGDGATSSPAAPATPATTAATTAK